MEAESKPIDSPARMIGVNLQTYSRECRGSSKGRVAFSTVMVCLISSFAAMGLSGLDGNYLIPTRMTSIIRRVVAIGALLEARSGATAASTTTILVAENDNRQRLVAKTTLERYGYSVMLADNESEMLSIFRRCAPRVALVILDRTVLRHSTQDVVWRLKGIRPDIRILVSPRPGDGRRPRSALRDSIAKPLSAPLLAEAVRKALSGLSPEGTTALALDSSFSELRLGKPPGFVGSRLSAPGPQERRFAAYIEGLANAARGIQIGTLR